MQRSKALLLALAGVAGMTAAASAATVGYNFAVLYTPAQASDNGVITAGSGEVITKPIDSNTPYLYLENTGSVAITSFSLELTAPNYVFDFVQRMDTHGGGYTFTNDLPGGLQNNGGPNPAAPYSKTVEFSFAGGFDLNEIFSFQTDIDPNELNASQLRTALAGAKLTVNFDGGSSITQSFGASLPTDGNAYTLSYIQAGAPTAVPLPASALGGMGLLGAMSLGRAIRRRSISA